MVLVPPYAANFEFINMKQLRFLLCASLVVNVFLLVCVVGLVIKPMTKTNPSVGSEVASGLQMDIGYENGPVLLLLDRDFDRNASFALFDKTERLMVSRNGAYSTGRNGTKKASIALGEDLELAAHYTPDQTPQFGELELTMADRILQDLNADGQYDLRIWLPWVKKTNGRTAGDVWFNNEWQEVPDGLEKKEFRSVNRLKGDLTVSFNRSSGHWEPVAPTKQDQP